MAEPLRYHLPVLATETVALLQPAPGRVLVDGTFGGGGHTGALLAAGARVIALDRDPDALAHGAETLGGAGGRLTLVRSDFRRVSEVLSGLGVEKVDGLLLDLGVSSWQLDTPERGFSFRNDGPLDMRMDPGAGVTAADLVNTLSEAELADLFFRLGEEPASRRIARALVARRTREPFRTTLDLAQAVEGVVPRRGRTHPATRVFQALRMEVNDELGALREALEAAADILNPGGRLVVITFHSLEDRMVKDHLRAVSAETIDRPEWPEARPNPRRAFRLLTRRPVEPGPEELAGNPRARSARLRAAERIGPC